MSSLAATYTEYRTYVRIADVLNGMALPVFRGVRHVTDVTLEKALDCPVLVLRATLGPHDRVEGTVELRHFGFGRSSVIDGIKAMLLRARARAEYINECRDGIRDLIDP